MFSAGRAPGWRLPAGAGAGEPGLPEVSGSFAAEFGAGGASPAAAGGGFGAALRLPCREAWGQVPLAPAARAPAGCPVTSVVGTGT